MDEEGLKAKLAEVEALLVPDPSNEAYLEYKRSLEEALEVLQESESESESSNGGDGFEEIENRRDSDQRVEEKTRRVSGDERVESLASSSAATTLGKRLRESEDEKEESKVEVTDRSIPKKRKLEMSQMVPGMIVEVFNSRTGVWNAATLEKFDSMKAWIKFLHLENAMEVEVPQGSIKKIKSSKMNYDKLDLKIGMGCLARYSGDGKWYKAVVLRPTRCGAVVRYRKYNNEEQVVFEHIMLSDDNDDADEEFKKRAASKNAVAEAMSGRAPQTATGNTEMEEPTKMILSEAIAKVPAHLQIKEGDSDSSKAYKRSMLKKLKREAKRAQKDLILDKKQQNWKTFQSKSKTKKKKKMTS